MQDGILAGDGRERGCWDAGCACTQLASLWLSGLGVLLQLAVLLLILLSEAWRRVSASQRGSNQQPCQAAQASLVCSRTGHTAHSDVRQELRSVRKSAKAQARDRRGGDGRARKKAKARGEENRAHKGTSTYLTLVPKGCGHSDMSGYTRPISHLAQKCGCLRHIKFQAATRQEKGPPSDEGLMTACPVDPPSALPPPDALEVNRRRENVRIMKWVRKEAKFWQDMLDAASSRQAFSTQKQMLGQWML